MPSSGCPDTKSHSRRESVDETMAIAQSLPQGTPEQPVIIIGAGVVGLTLAHGLANVSVVHPTGCGPCPLGSNKQGNNSKA